MVLSADFDGITEFTQLTEFLAGINEILTSFGSTELSYNSSP
jgi:hypothetical protein